MPLSVAKMWWCGEGKPGDFAGGGEGTASVSKSRTRRRAASRHVNNKASRFELNKAVLTRNRRTDRVRDQYAKPGRDGRRADKRSRRLPLSQNIPLSVPVRAAAGDSKGSREEGGKGFRLPRHKSVSFPSPPSLRSCLKNNAKKKSSSDGNKKWLKVCVCGRPACFASLGSCWSEWLGSVCSPLRLLAQAACVVRCRTLCSSFSPAPFLEICVSRSAVA